MAFPFQHKSKYGAKAVYIGGRRFASKLEGERWLFLSDAERRGIISDLRSQVKFRLPCGSGYVADFVYIKDGAEVVEDTKGVLTDVFKLKSKCLAQCPSLEKNFNIKIVKKATEEI